MHFALSDHRARRFLEGFAVLPDAARAMLLSGETRPQLHLSSGCAYGATRSRLCAVVVGGCWAALKRYDVL